VANGSSLEVYILAASGIAGYMFLRLNCAPAPFLLGFILGPMVEEHFRRAMLISQGDPTVFFTRPISAVLIVIAFALAVMLFVPSLFSLRKEVFADAEE